jgi:thiamine transport system permease protein
VLALLQLAAVAVAATIAGRLERGLGPTGRHATGHPVPEGRMRLVVAGVVLVSLGLLALPPLAVLRQALQVGDGWGLAHFAALADETPALLVTPWHAVVNSLVYAVVATAIALGVGAPAAVAIARGGDTFGVLVMLPLGASAAMLGFGFLLAFDSPPLDLRGSRAIVPLAQALVALPFVVRALVPALRSLDPRLGEAAATLGASPAVVRRTVELPLLGRALAAAAALAFAVSLGEFGATVFLARADAPTLPVAVFRFLGRPGADNVGIAAALSAVLVVLVAAVSLGAERVLVRRGLR